ncbi:MAG: RteC domain-containing protein [Ferruginibacter sp.]|nr:RteC domain-containing protein [Ferruginibacter sp.]
MNLSSLQLYAQMQEEINQAEAHCKNEIQKVESCFNIALLYLNKIKNHSESFAFRHETDEINFFKNIKPLFIAAMEYYTLRYHAVLFKPSNDKDQVVTYWLHQLKRVEIFYNQHREFYHYYTGGQTDRDTMYFTRQGRANNLPGKSSIKSRGSISPGYMAARILGHRKYRLHVELELEMLMQGDVKKSFRHNRSLLPANLLSPPEYAIHTKFSLQMTGCMFPVLNYISFL